jgi:DNA-directed RNA polymerase subunit L
MEMKILKNDKKEMDVQIDSLTIVEILRIYLNKEGAEVAAWKREHPSKPAILHIESDNPEKLLKKAITSLQKDLDKYSEEIKKAL